MPELDAPAKGDGALWMPVGGLRVAKDCRISSSVYEEEHKLWNETQISVTISLFCLNAEIPVHLMDVGLF